MNYFIMSIAIISIFLSFFRYINSHKYTKDCQGVIRIRNSRIPTAIFLIIGIAEFFTNLNGLNLLNITFQGFLNPFSKALPWLLSSIAYYDYNFITSNGVIINGKLYPWKEIVQWSYKLDFYNIIVLKVIPKDNNDAISATNLHEVEMKISDKSSKEVETILTQYLGEKRIALKQIF